MMVTQAIVDTGERLSKKQNKVHFSLNENNNNYVDFPEEIVTCSKIVYYKTIVQITLQPDVFSLYSSSAQSKREVEGEFVPLSETF